jgi:hypothetical protein
VAWRAHRHGDGLAVDADLERLLDGDAILLAHSSRSTHDVDPGRLERPAGVHHGSANSLVIVSNSAR